MDPDGSSNVRTEMQLKKNFSEVFNYETSILERKPDVLGQEFLQPAVLNPFGQSEVTLAAPIFGIFQSPTLSFPPFPQATNIIESQPSYSSFVGSHNKNNVLWPHQNPTHILGQPNTYFNSNSNLLIPHFYNQNTS